MTILLSPDGAFALQRHVRTRRALPYIEPPAGWFPDMRN